MNAFQAAEHSALNAFVGTGCEMAAFAFVVYLGYKMTGFKSGWSVLILGPILCTAAAAIVWQVREWMHANAYTMNLLSDAMFIHWALLAGNLIRLKIRLVPLLKAADKRIQKDAEFIYGRH